MPIVSFDTRITPRENFWRLIATCIVIAAMYFGMSRLLEKGAMVRSHLPTTANAAKMLASEPAPANEVGGIDAYLRGRFKGHARLCDNCNAMQEWSDTGYGKTRPLVVEVSDVENGSVGYTMVLGEAVETLNGDLVSVKPISAFYIGHRSGSHVRVDSIGGEYFDGESWRPLANHKILLEQVRKVFMNTARYTVRSSLDI